jgi:bis(5'-nucleosyl)-tetraphosphatase (symmetrical)
LRDDDTLKEILRAKDCEQLIDWLRYRPILHHDAKLNFAMLHAGLPPQWNLAQAKLCANELESALRDEAAMRELFAHMYGNQPDQWSPQLQGNDRLRFITNCFARLRVCDSQGRLNLKYKGALDDIPRDSFAWFQVPNRQSATTRIVCGHWSALDYYEGDNVYAIDTGCVWGERLCAIRLDGVDPASAHKPVFVKSKQKRSGKHRE